MTHDAIDAWLKQFRAQTPRPLREALIAAFEPTDVISQLKLVPGQYPLAVYLLSTNALEHPELLEQRKKLARALEKEFGRGIISDIQKMMTRLNRDHRLWQRRKSRPCPVETVPELVA